MRFDLVIDEDLKVYLLEANMSPNLSSAHYPSNQLLYEQVLYSLFSITGVASYLRNQGRTDKTDAASVNMISSDKNIAAWGLECNTVCRDCECAPACALCWPCLPAGLQRNLRRAHYEFLHRADFRRLYPPAMASFSVYHYMYKSTICMNHTICASGEVAGNAFVDSFNTPHTLVDVIICMFLKMCLIGMKRTHKNCIKLIRG
ncbi:hypothetical protein EVAR_39750_1 [Eumeta japonica]|uniref:Tubulin polyglutamylase TTLL5 n=1 Tax=Eumeta variegata TaxID=151549 RepID=A0A4C1X6Q5_EUMVA|nr:hypothetical protein EVAR_39750_1 [Eumeta japonica]